MRLSEQIAKVVEVYAAQREKYVEISEEIQQTDAEYNREKGRLNKRAYDALTIDHNEKIYDLKMEKQNLVDVFKAKVDEIRKETDAAFSDKYSVKPSKLDINALELLKADILSDAELVKMAEDYSENVTMQRMIAKYALQRAEQNKSKDLRMFANRLKNKSNAEPIHKASIDVMELWCEKALDKNSYKASRFAEMIEPKYNELLEQVDGICS